MSETIWVLVPVFGMTMIFGLGWLLSNYLVARTRARHQPDDQYRALADEAIRAQRELLDETRRLTASIREVERLLKEV